MICEVLSPSNDVDTYESIAACMTVPTLSEVMVVDSERVYVEIWRKDAAGAILYAAERATKVALDAIQLLGGNGYINDSATGRLLRDAKLYEIGAGTSEIRRMLIGRELFEETK